MVRVAEPITDREPTLAQQEIREPGMVLLLTYCAIHGAYLLSEYIDSKEQQNRIIFAEKLAAIQIPLQGISDPRNLKIQMTREMIVRGNVSSQGDSGKIRLTTGSRMRVYDVDSILLQRLFFQ